MVKMVLYIYIYIYLAVKKWRKNTIQDYKGLRLLIHIVHEDIQKSPENIK